MAVTVFLVDDDEEVVKSIEGALAKEHIRVVSATEPEKAVSLAQNYVVDILLLDLHMPRLNGLEVLKLVRAKQPHVRVVVITAYYGQHKGDLAEAKVDVVLQKPFSGSRLIRTLVDLVGSIETMRSPEPVEGVVPAARVLIVDDERDVCESLSYLLTETPKPGAYRIEVAHSGEEAVRKSAAFEPDVLIVDVLMAGLSGRAVAERLKKQAHPPKCFIFVTASPDEDLERDAGRSGDLYFTKPFRTDDFLEALSRKCVSLGLVGKATA